MPLDKIPFWMYPYKQMFTEHDIRRALSLSPPGTLSALSICSARGAYPASFFRFPTDTERKQFMETLSSLLMLAASIVFVVLLIKVLFKPIKGILKFIFNAVLGYILLFVISFFGEFIGLTIDLSVVNIVIAGLLGVPGVILVTLASFLF